jgi:hypothetical protein
MNTCIDNAWLERHPDVLAFVHSASVKHPLDRAHPYPPGSGPRGQTCGTCAKLCTRHYSRKYFKCHVLMKFWSAGPATDIRKKDPACLCWEPRIDKLELHSTALRHRPGEYPPGPRPLLGSRMDRRRQPRTTN